MSFHKILGLAILLLASFTIRLELASREANFDIESYRLVADLRLQGKNVYKETWRYNYGPVWMLVLEKLRMHTSSDEAFRMAVAVTLAGADTLLALLLGVLFGWCSMIIYLLCPVFWVISGTHSQFDGLALLFALGALGLFQRSGVGNSATPKIWLFAGGIILLGLSLSTKHILLLFPFLFLFLPLGWPWRLAGALLPIVLMHLSFAPFSLIWPWPEPTVWNYAAAFKFGWLAHNPLHKIQFLQRYAPSLSFWRALFSVFIGWQLWRWRKFKLTTVFGIYLLAAFAWQPGAALQYLVIPALAIVLFPSWFGFLFIFLIWIHFTANYRGTVAPPLWGHIGEIQLYKLQLLSLTLWYFCIPNEVWHAPHWMDNFKISYKRRLEVFVRPREAYELLPAFIFLALGASALAETRAFWLFLVAGIILTWDSRKFNWTRLGGRR